MQAVLPLHDGFSLFDPFVNASTCTGACRSRW
jgi:hypothetical protein